MTILNEIAHKKGYDSVSLGKMFNVSQSKMWRILHQKQKKIDIELTKKIIDLLGCSFDEVFENKTTKQEDDTLEGWDKE